MIQLTLDFAPYIARTCVQHLMKPADINDQFPNTFGTVYIKVHNRTLCANVCISEANKEQCHDL